MFIRSFLLAPVLFIVPVASSLSLAGPPVLLEDQGLTQLTRSALAQGVNHFQFNSKLGNLIYLIHLESDFFPHSIEETHETRENLLKYFSKFKLESSQEEEGHLNQIYRVTFEKKLRLQDAHFTLTAIDYDRQDDGPIDLLKTKFDLQCKIQSRLNQLEKANPKIEELKKMNRAIFDERDKTQRSKLITLRAALIAEGAQIPHPLNIVKTIKRNLVPMLYQEIPDRAFLAIMVERGRLGADLMPVNTKSELAAETFTEDASLQTCTLLGGTPLKSKAGQEEVYLCRIGQGEIGAGALHRFYTERKAPYAIEALLHYLPHSNASESSDEDLALVPVFDPITGKMKNVGVQKGMSEKLRKIGAEPAFRLIVSPTARMSDYCRQTKGTPTRILNIDAGVTFQVCVYEDGSGIEVNTLNEGPTSDDNKEMMIVLQNIQAGKI